MLFQIGPMLGHWVGTPTEDFSVEVHFGAALGGLCQTNVGPF